MEDKITGYLETKTNSNDIWVTIDAMVNDLFPNIQTDPNEMVQVFEFETSLSMLIMQRVVRIQEVSDTTSPNQFKVALESNITEILNERKLSAIEEMKETLEELVYNEDYESAAEYRDMIEEYENKNK